MSNLQEDQIFFKEFPVTTGRPRYLPPPGQIGLFMDDVPSLQLIEPDGTVSAAGVQGGLGIQRQVGPTEGLQGFIPNGAVVQNAAIANGGTITILLPNLPNLPTNAVAIWFSHLAQTGTAAGNLDQLLVDMDGQGNFVAQIMEQVNPPQAWGGLTLAPIWNGAVVFQFISGSGAPLTSLTSTVIGYVAP